MAHKRYLWVMKSLIRKILREQGEDINSQEDYDRIVKEKRSKKRSRNGKTHSYSSKIYFQAEF